MRKVSRSQCVNCTCSPGLLSRTNKRSSRLAKQVSLKRGSGSGSPKGGSRKGSVFTIDVSSLCVPGAKEVNTSMRLEKLRKMMAEYDLGVYIVPSEDEHQSEYVSAADQRKSFISGFLGSAGVAIVTRDVMCMNETPEGVAALSTDGRYFNQANNELDFNWRLLRQGAKDEPTWEEWTVYQACQLSLDSGNTINIGVDPKLISYQLYEKFSKLIQEKTSSGKYLDAKVEFLAVKDNLIDKIWGQFEEVPSAPSNIIKVLDSMYTGQETTEKVDEVVGLIQKNKCTGMVLSALDEIAWLLNMRGSDIEFNPVFYSYLIVTSDKKVTLFADHLRFDTKVQDALKASNVDVEPYGKFWENLIAYSRDLNQKNEKLLIPRNASWEIVRSLKCSYEQALRSPVEDLKSIKNKVELDGARSAHLKDGRALCRFFSWLEKEVTINGELIDEVKADEKLTELRKQEENFVGLSFSTISATGANGAIIHYKPIKGECQVIDPNKIYLNDSGSQFLDGTTDVTRTMHFGVPTPTQIRNYTLVLKGHVSLSMLKFPENTTGAYLDSIARQYLWSYGLDYGHGTSHGVGAFLNVHEGPIGISPRQNAATSTLKPGHLLSNEPGYYEDGEYGIRIENVMFVKDAGYIYDGKSFLEFDTVTRVPYCRRLIDISLLSPEEKRWINSYHQTVWNEISPSFKKHSTEYNWLKKETAPL